MTGHFSDGLLGLPRVDSLEAGEGTYRRDRRYDRLLSLLFPDMAKWLPMELPGDRSKYHSHTTQQELHYEDAWDVFTGGDTNSEPAYRVVLVVWSRPRQVG